MTSTQGGTGGAPLMPMGGSNTGVLPGSGGSGGAAAGSGGTGVAAGAGGGATAGAAGMSAGGTGGAAGAGGAVAGTAGAAGAAGAPAGAEGDLRAGPSAGCNGQVNDPYGEDVEHSLLGDRLYWTRLPDAYDGTTPVPIVFYGPGCGIANNVEGAPLDGSISADAMRVFLVSTGGCFDTGGPESPEGEYFETALAEIEAAYCTDLSKVFLAGYSSGGWLTNQLACSHGDLIRGIGTAAGGMPDPSAQCVGRVAAMMHAGTGDTANPIENIDDGVDRGSGAAKERIRLANNCTDQTMPWGDIGYCQQYVGCDPGYEVVWCVEDTGHSNGGEVSQHGWWDFWSALP
ncbi:MAG TPA: hypothetical protein VHO25_14960 [Polyangiaceae bacterium]|nr:hypothetical protein [Polyangiaceae bacterium]